ncbi:MAG: hypothetical protein WCV72_00305 [Patescibacteria group bacterium]
MSTSTSENPKTPENLKVSQALEEINKLQDPDREIGKMKEIIQKYFDPNKPKPEDQEAILVAADKIVAKYPEMQFTAEEFLSSIYGDKTAENLMAGEAPEKRALRLEKDLSEFLNQETSCEDGTKIIDVLAVSFENFIIENFDTIKPTLDTMKAKVEKDKEAMTLSERFDKNFSDSLTETMYQQAIYLLKEKRGDKRAPGTIKLVSHWSDVNSKLLGEDPDQSVVLNILNLPDYLKQNKNQLPAIMMKILKEKNYVADRSLQALTRNCNEAVPKGGKRFYFPDWVKYSNE